jgi:hypothetical protein
VMATKTSYVTHTHFYVPFLLISLVSVRTGCPFSNRNRLAGYGTHCKQLGTEEAHHAQCSLLR